ncbi:MAG: FMN-binding protein [Actinomycetota bacterium]|nr:FMN-binding protein [Actinomycetota bacterium]
MKRTLSLIGLLVIGLLLLFNPDTGLVTAVTSDMALAQATPLAPSTTTGEPPPTVAPTTEVHRSTTSTSAAPSSTSTTITTPVNGSALGASVPTEFGPFQVEVIIEDGEMVDIVTIAEPTDRKSQRINNQVIPLYEEAVISTQSADIDAITGATVTWSAYTASIRSAMDEAGI